MKIYHIQSHNSKARIVFHFGLGLVGSAIRDSLQNRFTITHEQHVTIEWDNLEIDSYFTSLVNLIKDHIETKNIRDYSTTVILSSGKIGFGSTLDQVEHEISLFSRLVELLEHLVDSKVLHKNSKIILISSAGGLFEGQVNVNHTSQVKPKRPYGVAKLEMEKILINHDYFNNYHILRLSSVYSSKSIKNRLGLIAVLVSNGIKNNYTSIYGNMDTIRDYIYDEDIGDYIGLIVFSEPTQSIEFIVSGVPTSIFQLKIMVERILGKKIYMQIKDSVNAENITFDSAVKPIGLSITDLEVSTRKLYNTLL